MDSIIVSSKLHLLLNMYSMPYSKTTTYYKHGKHTMPKALAALFIVHYLPLLLVPYFKKSTTLSLHEYCFADISCLGRLSHQARPPPKFGATSHVYEAFEG